MPVKKRKKQAQAKLEKLHGELERTEALMAGFTIDPATGAIIPPPPDAFGPSGELISQTPVNPPTVEPQPEEPSTPAPSPGSGPSSSDDDQENPLTSGL